MSKVTMDKITSNIKINRNMDYSDYKWWDTDKILHYWLSKVKTVKKNVYFYVFWSKKMITNTQFGQCLQSVHQILITNIIKCDSTTKNMGTLHFSGCLAVFCTCTKQKNKTYFIFFCFTCILTHKQKIIK